MLGIYVAFVAAAGPALAQIPEEAREIRCKRSSTVRGCSAMCLGSRLSATLGDQLADQRGLTERIEVFGDHDERALTADDLVAIVIIEAAGRIGVPRIP